MIGLLRAVVGAMITRLALYFQPIVERRMVLLMPIVRLTIGLMTFPFVVSTDRPADNILFSGQDQPGPPINGATGWSIGALLLVILCKSLAYGAALTSFRGGPVFPAIFIGAAGAIDAR